MMHHAEYSNESCATAQTAILFFVVVYSYQRESPSSDFSLKSFDGKSVAQEIAIGSELVDDVDCHPCRALPKKAARNTVQE